MLYHHQRNLEKPDIPYNNHDTKHDNEKIGMDQRHIPTRARLRAFEPTLIRRGELQETATSALTRSSPELDGLSTQAAADSRAGSTLREKLITGRFVAATAAEAEAAAAAAVGEASSLTGTATEGVVSVRKARLPACCDLRPDEGDADGGEARTRLFRFRF